MTDIPSPERAPMTDEQPSKEALKAASAALNDGLRKFRKRYFDFDLSDIARAEIAASFALALDRFAAARVREERERGNALRATAEAVRSSIFYRKIPMTSNPTKDAERLAGLRRMLGGGYAIELRPVLSDALKWIEALTQERDEAIESRDAQVADLKLEIEDWRGRLATQCGETLAARKERDEARRSAEALQERVAAVDAERKRQREMLGDPRKGVHLPPADWGPPQNATQPSADDVEQAREPVHWGAIKHMLEAVADHDAELADSFEQIIRGAIDAERDAARREGAELRALDEAARDALSPFAAVGQWLFARPEVPDDTPMVDIEGLNGHHAALTRGHFKAAFTAYDALAARPRDVATTEQSDE